MVDETKKLDDQALLKLGLEKLNEAVDYFRQMQNIEGQTLAHYVFANIEYGNAITKKTDGKK